MLRRPSFSRGKLLALLSCYVGTAACHPITDAPTQGIATFTLPSTGVADGGSIVAFQATVDPLLLPANRSVTFTTTVGKINDATGSVIIAADSAGVARGWLRAPSDSASGYVSAAAGNATVSNPITFHKAHAQAIVVTLDKFVLDTGYANSATVTITLRRVVGTPSPGDTVHLTATDAASNPVGRFSSPSLSSTQGQITALFTLGPLTSSQSITITATGQSDAATAAIGTAVLQARVTPQS